MKAINRDDEEETNGSYLRKNLVELLLLFARKTCRYLMVSSVYHFCYFFGTLVYLQSYVVNVKFSHPWQFHKTWNRHLYWKEFSDSKYQKCLDMVIILLLQDQGVRNCCSWYRRFWQILYNIKVLYLSQNYSLPVIKTPLQKKPSQCADSVFAKKRLTLALKAILTHSLQGSTQLCI